MKKLQKHAKAKENYKTCYFETLLHSLLRYWNGVSSTSHHVTWCLLYSLHGCDLRTQAVMQLPCDNFCPWKTRYMIVVYNAMLWKCASSYNALTFTKQRALREFSVTAYFHIYILFKRQSFFWYHGYHPTTDTKVRKPRQIYEITILI